MRDSVYFHGVGGAVDSCDQLCFLTRNIHNKDGVSDKDGAIDHNGGGVTVLVYIYISILNMAPAPTCC